MLERGKCLSNAWFGEENERVLRRGTSLMRNLKRTL